jgi:hypothetical protein
MLIAEPPWTKDDDGAPELASKQHSMWIAELLENSWSDNVIERICLAWSMFSLT